MNAVLAMDDATCAARNTVCHCTPPPMAFSGTTTESPGRNSAFKESPPHRPWLEPKTEPSARIRSEPRLPLHAAADGLLGNDYRVARTQLRVQRISTPQALVRTQDRAIRANQIGTPSATARRRRWPSRERLPSRQDATPRSKNLHPTGLG